MSIHARYVWAYLPCHADRDGRLKDSAFNLKAEIFPGDAVDVEAILAELASRRLVIRYEVAGLRYIQIRSFLRYQNPHKREPASAIPAPTQTQPGSAQKNLGSPVDDGESSQWCETIEDEPSRENTGLNPAAPRTGPAVRSDQVQSGTVIPDWPGPPKDPDPITVTGLTALIRAAVEKAHPEIGLYQPGHWATRAAVTFLDAIPAEARTDLLRAEVKRRIAIFAASTDARITKGSWAVEAFCEAYNRLGQASRPGVGSAEAASRRMAAKVAERGR